MSDSIIILSDMSTLFFPRLPQRSVLLWRAFWRALQPLRPACSRTSTFLWLVVVLAALCLRPDLAGVTSLVRGLGLSEASYYGLLHFFHSPALDLERLTRLWQQTLQRLFRRHLVRVNGRAVVLVDGLKRPKEGKKMPGVKSLHQESRCNAKASFIMGHSLQAVAVLAQAAGVYLAVPVAARIHEGVVWSNRDRRTLLDKLAALLAGLPWDQAVTVVADAYYAAAKFARSLLADGHHLVTRVRTTAVAYFPASPPKGKRRGRRARYGDKSKLHEWFRYEKDFTKASSPVYGETGVTLRYYTFDLFWRKLGRLVRFVWVIHPTRGRLVLLCTDLTPGALGDHPPLWLAVQNRGQFQTGHSHRRRLCLSLLDARHEAHPARGTVHSTPHRQSESYRQAVRRKLAAYERHIQLGSHRPRITPVPGPPLSAGSLVQLSHLHPHSLAPKTSLRVGRGTRAPPHVAAISRWFTRKR
jgi:hypothetical protein